MSRANFILISPGLFGVDLLSLSANQRVPVFDTTTDIAVDFLYQIVLPAGSRLCNAGPTSLPSTIPITDDASHYFDTNLTLSMPTRQHDYAVQTGVIRTSYMELCHEYISPSLGLLGLAERYLGLYNEGMGVLPRGHTLLREF